MKKNILLLSLFFITVFFYSCNKDNPAPKENPISDIELSQKDAALIQSSNKFGLELFTKIAKEQKDSNLFISPMSIAFALAMTYNGADGSTKEAMENTLKLSGLTTDEINRSFKYLINALINLDPKVTLEIANSIWYRNTYSVLESFLQVNRNYYNAEVSALDFNNPASVDIINNWCADKTHDKITEVIQEIDPETIMFLINAIYFKGTWTYEFDETETQNRNFYLTNGAIKQVPTMQMKVTVDYFTDDTLQIIDLPYGGKKYSMMIILPNYDYNCDDILEQLNDENWKNWINGFEESEINIFLPKFRFEYNDTLNKVLSTMGMEIAFSPYLANFSKINPNNELYISKVFHKSYIDVNEQGTEAAAVTVVEVNYTSVGDEIYFNANKPFIFAIREKSTNSILFIGKLADPVYEE